jgi:lipoprotein-releasing system ATP-binding protein
MSEPILQAVKVFKSYGKDHTKVEVLRGASFDVAEGEFVAIKGPSGSGKSTLLHLLGGLDTPDSGDVLYRGEPLTRMCRGDLDAVRNRVFGFVFQFYHLLGEFNAVENVMMPGMIAAGPLEWLGKRREARKKAAALLDELGLGERLTHRPSELSGGEQQRVAIARAMMGGPEILLSDEPTGNLDEKTSRGIIELLLDVNRRGQTMVVVTHEDDLAALAHRTVELHEGRIMEETNTSAKESL